MKEVKHYPKAGLQTLINDTILKAIIAKTPCYITHENDGVTMMSYQDKIGIKQRLELYMSNTDGYSECCLILSILSNKTGEQEGSLLIDWDKVRQCNLSQDTGSPNGRILITIDGLKINFLEGIKS